jgi:hypothetical protein
MRFQPGDAVRVARLPHSEWQGEHGVIAEIVEHGEAGPDTQECAVQFAENRRCWFLSIHLTKTIPERLVRFFRAEVSERWKNINHNEILRLDGDRDQLIAMLQEECSFALRRAQIEVDEFFSEFDSRISQARLEPRSTAAAAAKTASAGPGMAA